MTMGYPAIAIIEIINLKIIFNRNITTIPAGTVVSPAAGRTRASKRFACKAASIPRVAPSSLSKARDWKKVELRPVVASLSMRLNVEISDR